jgi:hypothetical protein
MPENCLSNISTVSELCEKISLLKATPDQLEQLIKELKEDKESFSRIFVDASSMFMLITEISNIKVRDIIFHLMLSDTHFYRMFPNSRSFHHFTAYLNYLKTNVWQHPDFNELAIHIYYDLFIKKFISPDTLNGMCQGILDNFVTEIGSKYYAITHSFCKAEIKTVCGGLI